MRLTKSEIQILELFTNNIFLELSINSIAKTLDKHYRVIRVNVLSLIKKNLLKTKDLAGAKVISLNSQEPTLPMYMAYVEEPKTYLKVCKFLPQINDIISKARQISPSFCLGLFGSHAKNNQKKDSDIDLFLIADEKHLKQFQSLINQFPSIQDIVDWNVFSVDEFKSGLKEKGTLVYKEIIKNKAIIKGTDLFYNMISEVGSINQSSK